MTIKKRRLLRLIVMGLAVVCAVAAGFLWAQHSNVRGMSSAALVTALCLVLVVAVESLAGNAEREIELLYALIEKATGDDVISDESDRELNRIIDMLSDQNAKYRAMLLHDKVVAVHQATIAKHHAPSAKAGLG